ncbi:hypothetical protein, partial [Armatimonas sp.]|uniref:hypothetical protein n=1 Tax=Armatimonas sp. TaxID=1872638 RepID=UPI00286CD5A6
MRQPLDIAREILQRSDATADQLRYVYRQSHVMPSHELPWAMESLVRNPNCPADIFTELFPKFANHALQNPSWMLFLLEGSFLMHLNRGFVFTTLWEEFSSRPLLEALILHPIPWIAEAAR